jgi:chorismate mutase
MKDLDIKSPVNREGSESRIDELNSEIDMVDDLLVRTIASRMELSRQIEKIGDPRYVMTQKPIQMQKTFARLHGLATEEGLRPEFIKRLFDEITREALLLETSLRE